MELGKSTYLGQEGELLELGKSTCLEDKEKRGRVVGTREVDLFRGQGEKRASCWNSLRIRFKSALHSQNSNGEITKLNC